MYGIATVNVPGLLVPVVPAGVFAMQILLASSSFSVKCFPSHLASMAGCKSGKNVVEIRRSGTKRQQNLNLVNEPMEHKKNGALLFVLW